jgi:hypothetical protein
MSEDHREDQDAATEHALRERARERVRRRRNFHTHVIAHIVASAFLTLVWAITEYNNAGGWPTALRTGRMDHDWDPWIIYPLMAGTLALGAHAWIAFGPRAETETEIEREIERLRADFD